MLNVHFYRPDEIPDAQLRFAVIAANGSSAAIGFAPPGSCPAAIASAARPSTKPPGAS